MEYENLMSKLNLQSDPNPNDEKLLAMSPSSSTNNVEVDASSKVRHCGYCLKQYEPSLVKLCSKCKRRGYCSKDCQTADWSIKGNGQRHVNWCGRYDYGEEDIDWKVVPVPDKGLGIRAQRLLPAGFKIIVEPVFTDPRDHPGIMDLAPIGASLKEKFELNRFENGDCKDRDGGKPVVGLRISRVNHNCRPNAAHAYDDVARVGVLYALRDIHSNEEIRITYRNFASLAPVRPNPNSARTLSLDPSNYH